MFESNIKVLIVDDEKQYLESFKQVLITLDCRVDAVTTSKEAYEFVEENNGSYDLIFLDHVLKANDLNGIETMELIHKKYPNLRIVLVTQFMDKISTGFDPLKILELHSISDAYFSLQKPINLEQITKLLKHVKDENELLLRKNKLEILDEVVMKLQKANTTKQIFQVALKGLISLGFDRARLYFLEKDETNHDILVGSQFAGLTMKNPFSEFVINCDDIPPNVNLKDNKGAPVRVQLDQYKEKPWFNYLELEDVKEILECPLFIGDRVLGLLTVDNKKSGKRIFQFEEQYVKNLIGHFCLAYQNIESYQELKSFIKLSKKITEQNDFVKMMDTACEIICTHLKSEKCDLFIFDESNNILTRIASHIKNYDSSKVLFEENYKSDESLTRMIFDSEKPYITNNLNEEVHLNRTIFDKFKKKLPSGKTEQALFYPIFYKGKKTGILRITNKFDPQNEKDPSGRPKLSKIGFTQDDQDVLKLLSYQIASTIKAYENLEELKFRMEQLEWLEELSSEITKSVDNLDMLTFLTLTGITIKFGLRFNRAALFLYDENNKTLSGYRGMGPRSGLEANQLYEEEYWLTPRVFKDLKLLYDEMKEKVWEDTWNSDIISFNFCIDEAPTFKTVMETGRAIHENYSETKHTDYFLKKADVKEFVIVPLQVEDKKFGVIYVDRKFDEKKIMERGVRFLQLFAATTAVTLRIRQQAKVNEKTFFQMAHHLGHRINVVNDSAELLKKFYYEYLDQDVINNNDKWLKCINNICEEGNHFRFAVEELLKYRQLKKGNLKYNFVNAKICDLLNKVIADYNFAFSEKNIKCKEDFKIKVSENIYCDELLIKMALYSFLDNAIKFSKENSEIIISVDKLRNKIVVSIADFGVGIPEEELLQVGNEYFRGKFARENMIEGSGIGFVFASGIVKNHKGEVSLSSEYGKGTTVKLSLPSI